MTRKERRGHEPETVSLLAEAFTPSLANFSLRSRLALRRCLSAQRPSTSRSRLSSGVHGTGTSAFRDREADGFRFAVAQNILPGLVPGCPAWDRQQDRMENYISNRIPATIRTQSSVPTNMPLMHPVAGFRALFGDLNILLLPFVSKKS